MVTCRCSICGTKNAGRAGARAFGAAVTPRDERGRSFVAANRKAERRYRRRIEARAWKEEAYSDS